jgi:tetratricopeptide (TPR) repeat protein
LFYRNIEVNPENEWGYLSLAWGYESAGELTKAEDILKQAIRANPRKDSSYLVLADLYFRQSRFSEAEDTYRKAIDISAFDQRGYVELSTCLRKQKKIEEAENVLRSALERNPSSEWLSSELSDVCRERGRVRESAEILRKAADPGPEKRVFDIAVSLQEGQTAKSIAGAENILTAAIESHPLYAWSYILLSRLYRAEGRLPESEGILEKAIEMNPRDEWAYVELRSCYEKTRDRGRQEEIMRRVTVINPRNDGSARGIGWFFAEEDKRRFLHLLLERSAQLVSDNAAVYYLRGLVFLEGAAYRDAGNMFLKANQLQPANGVYGALMREMQKKTNP